ncbi:MAG: hypothetical protein JO230_15930 [Xanthobacteraceae bacterium]|nr:hypothetical protein [Xanthobacteraceae bacterium]
MPHKVDGFELRFTGRTSWKAERRCRGAVIDVIPVTWTKGWSKTSEGTFLQVWFRNADDREQYLDRREPFVVAVGVAKDYEEFPHQFSHFTSVFRVLATGKVLSEHSIETRVIERVTAR